MIHLENVLKTSFQDVLKMSWRRLGEAFRKSLRGFCKTSRGRLKTSWRCLGKTPWRCLEDVLKTSPELLQIVLKMSWRRLCKTFWRHLWNDLKTTWRRMAKMKIFALIKTFWKRLQEIFWRRMAKTNIRLDRDVLKTSSEKEDERRLLKKKTKEVFKTSSRRLHLD